MIKILLLANLSHIYMQLSCSYASRAIINQVSRGQRILYHRYMWHLSSRVPLTCLHFQLLVSLQLWLELDGCFSQIFWIVLDIRFDIIVYISSVFLKLSEFCRILLAPRMQRIDGILFSYLFIITKEEANFCNYICSWFF